MFYSLHFPNVFCTLEGERFESFTAAVTAGKRGGFEFAVFETMLTTTTRLASWSPITGLRMHDDAAVAARMAALT